MLQSIVCVSQLRESNISRYRRDEMRRGLALSVRQPWAWLICAGYKDIENRNWESKLNQRIFIHASKTHDTAAGYRAAFDTLRSIYGPSEAELVIVSYWTDAKRCTGAIIGEADITGCVTKSGSPWFAGRYGFTLANPTLYDKPVPCRGQLGFFTVEFEE